jgi:hypothetical protein
MSTTARRPDAASRPALPADGSRGARRTRPPRARAVAAVLAAGAALLLSGCGLRWETEPPAEPVPDAVEQARRTAVDDALALTEAARAALDGADEQAAGVLTLVVDAAATQVDALGGEYDSGLPEPEPDEAAPSASPAASAAAATPADVLALLGTAASTARADALTAEDEGLARLLASVATSRAQLTDRLAAALGVEAPAVDAEPGTDWPSGGAADGSGSGDGSATSPTPTPSGSATPTGTPTPAATGADGGSPGSDLDRADLVALVLAEDQAGFGFEVAAARLSDDARSLARDAAAEHRAAATAWATAAGIAGTGDDPRRVSYELDGDVSSAEAVRAFCAGLLTDLATVHADAVLATDARSADRTATVDGLRTAAVEALRWGGTPTPLPGLPDAPAASPTPTAG